MYGLVNRGIEQLVVSLKGEAAWRQICLKAGVDDTGFVAMCPYSDELTYRLVGAVSEALDMPAEQVLQAFGEYWVLYTAQQGYGELMDAGGANLREFLSNLNDMHGRVETVFPDMQLPLFRVVDLTGHTDGAYELQYESQRSGLAPMVMGLVRGLAQRFGEQVEVVLSGEPDDSRPYTRFTVRPLPACRPSPSRSPGPGTRGGSLPLPRRLRGTPWRPVRPCWTPGASPGPSPSISGWTTSCASSAPARRCARRCRRCSSGCVCTKPSS